MLNQVQHDGMRHCVSESVIAGPKTSLRVRKRYCGSENVIAGPKASLRVRKRHCGPESVIAGYDPQSHPDKRTSLLFLNHAASDHLSVRSVPDGELSRGDASLRLVEKDV